MKTQFEYAVAALLIFVLPTDAETQTAHSLRTVVDLNMGETEQVVLCDGKSVSVTVQDVDETRDVFRDAVRDARVKVRVDGQEVVLISPNNN